MSRRKPHRRVISRIQAETLHTLLFKESRDDAWDANADAVRGECLQASQQIEYALLSEKAAAQSCLHSHVSQCQACRAEIARLRHFAHLWETEDVWEQMHTRIAQTPSFVFACSVPLNHIPLHDLIHPAGAFGESLEGDRATVEFAVQEADGSDSPLRGMMTRQNRDFYLQIYARQSEIKKAFAGRIALVTLVTSPAKAPLLQRHIEIGVTILLGTDLRLTKESYLEAALLPPA
jgi:hypothetical protein